MRLKNGDRVCIIGGGPAGSFSALHLLAFARAAGLSLEVLLFEPRSAGPGSGISTCKGCAGILSGHAQAGLAALGITLPPDVVQSVIEEYAVHLGREILRIRQPNPGRKILSVYRGAGPRRHSGPSIASFDAYLLAQAAARGATVIADRVLQVEDGARPVVHTAFQSHPADLVVAAYGVNSHPVLDSGFGYAPPQVELMEQDELARPAAWPPDSVAVFFGRPKGLLFGAMIPKRDYLNVSLLGYRMGREPMREFYAAHDGDLRPTFGGEPDSLCGCHPHIPVRPASRYYGDRWVAVGDAAISRLYKDGIFSAYLSAEAAMRTAVTRGIRRQDFRSGYAPFYNRMNAENRYGRMLFGLALYFLDRPWLAQIVIRRLRTEGGLPFQEKLFSRLLWGMLTGEESYRDLFRLILRPGTAGALLSAALRQHAGRGAATTGASTAMSDFQPVLTDSSIPERGVEKADHSREPVPPCRAMTIHAHPDDQEFTIAGTLAKWARAGCEIVSVCITSGDAGSNDPAHGAAYKPALAALREEEQRAAAAVLGVKECVFLRHPDGALVHTLELRRELTRLIRRHKPDVVFCGDPSVRFYGSSYMNHPDHRAAADAACDAVFPSAGTRLIFTELLDEGLEPHEVKRLFIHGSDAPDTWVDISATIDTKIRALRCHHSQVGEGGELDKMMREWAEEDGKKRGMKYAEAYRVMELKES